MGLCHIGYCLWPHGSRREAVPRSSPWGTTLPATTAPSCTAPFSFARDRDDERTFSNVSKA